VIKLSEWQKVKEKTLINRFGKKVKQVLFKNPINGKDEEFILFGQRDGATILPLTPEGMVVTILEFKQGANKILCNLPSGTADFEGEPPAEIVKRELLEETGYRAKEIIPLEPPFWMASRSSWTKFYTFLGLGCEKVKEEIDKSEIVEVKLYSLKDWLKMAQTEIEEPGAIIATFRALPYLTQHLGG
jgi:8-oxo-dGTP pyrophosphatase MutT (NUDIX family)